MGLVRPVELAVLTGQEGLLFEIGHNPVVIVLDSITMSAP